LDDYVALATGLALVGGLLLARVLGIRLATHLLGGTGDDLVSMSILIPKGTAAAVLAGLPIQIGLARGAQMQDLINGVVFVSILATAILVFLAERARPAERRI
jgi:Kef-type K+ transport system membrane component KefB